MSITLFEVADGMVDSMESDLKEIGRAVEKGEADSSAFELRPSSGCERGMVHALRKGLTLDYHDKNVWAFDSLHILSLHTSMNSL